MDGHESTTPQEASGANSSIVERKFPRFASELVCLYSKDNGPQWNGTAFNLSQGGCAVLGTTPVQKGDYLRVLIFPSVNRSPIEVVLAPVRWATAKEFGVEFIKLSPADTKRLMACLNVIGNLKDDPLPD